MRTLLMIPLIVLAIGCQSIYTGTVALTKAVEDATREYAQMYNASLIPPDVAAKVSVAHAEYRKAAGVAADALEAYKAGKTVDTKAALTAAKVAADHFIDLLVGLLSKEKVMMYRTQVQKAQVL